MGSIFIKHLTVNLQTTTHNENVLAMNIFVIISIKNICEFEEK